MDTQRYVAAAALLAAAGGIHAQTSISVSSEIFARAFDGGAGQSDTIAFVQSPLPGVSFSHEVSEENPQLSAPVTASSELSISRPHNFRPTSSPSQFLYDIDVTGRLIRSTPRDFIPGPGARADLEIVFDAAAPAVGLPVLLSGSASYTSNQGGVGSVVPVPAFEIFGRGPGGENPIAGLFTDLPNAGSEQFTNVPITVFPSDLVLRSRADLSDQLTFDDGTSQVDFNVTITFLGPIPAPSSAALLALAGLAATRRRR